MRFEHASWLDEETFSTRNPEVFDISKTCGDGAFAEDGGEVEGSEGLGAGLGCHCVRNSGWRKGVECDGKDVSLFGRADVEVECNIEGVCGCSRQSE
jgi:hypothetical protein